MMGSEWDKADHRSRAGFATLGLNSDAFTAALSTRARVYCINVLIVTFVLVGCYFICPTMYVCVCVCSYSES